MSWGKGQPVLSFRISDGDRALLNKARELDATRKAMFPSSNGYGYWTPSATLSEFVRWAAMKVAREFVERQTHLEVRTTPPAASDASLSSAARTTPTSASDATRSRKTPRGKKTKRT